MRKLYFIVAFCVAALTKICATPTPNQAELAQNYISRFLQIASVESARSGIPTSIILAQGIHESQCGRSRLATAAHNHFGIKCKKEEGGLPLHDDDTYANGKPRLSYFKRYRSAEASYRHHTDFLMKNERYFDLFRYERTDYVSWAYGLKACGYATDPLYAEKLIKIVDTYNLHAYDLPMILSLDEEEDNENQDIAATASDNDGQLAIEITPQTVGNESAEEYTHNVIRNEKEEGLFEITNFQTGYTETKAVVKPTRSTPRKTDKIDENNILYEVSNDYAPLKPTTAKKQR